MINLIKNELCKIFHKKSIYIVLSICFFIVLLINIISSSETNEYISYNEKYIERLKEETKNIDISLPENIEWYISNKSEIDIYDLMEKYKNSWQEQIISSKAREYIYQINQNTYGFEKDEKNLNYAKKELSKMIEKFDNNDWLSFAEEEKTEYQEKLNRLNKQLENETQKTIIDGLKNQIYNSEVDLELINIRINQNIIYGRDYLNGALDNYGTSKKTLHELEFSKPEDTDLHNEYKENIEISKYILDTKHNINETGTMRSMYQSFYSNYLYIILAIIIIISGSIVSEEYNKGTIKLLLIKPYSRNKILLSKYITCFIMMIFSILFVFICQTLLGLIFLDSTTLSIPIVNYSFITNSLSIMSVLKYFIVLTIVTLPKIILILTLAFSLGTIFASAPVAIAIPLIGIAGTELLNTIVISKKIEFMKYWVTLNWDFEQYLFSLKPQFKYVNLNFSIIICLIYLLIMIIVSFITFKKKNIKNI